MSLRRSAALSLIWTGLEGGVATLLSVISLFVMAHIVGPGDFGVVALALGIVAITKGIIEFLFQDALVQREDLTDAHERTAHFVSIALGVGLFVLCALAALPLSWLFRAPDFPLVFVVCASVLPLSGFISVPTARLRRSFDFKTLALRTIASRIIGTIIGPVLALLGFGIWSFVAQHLVSTVLSIVLVLQAAPARIAPAFDRAGFREIFAFGAPRILTSLVQATSLRLFTLLVGSFLDVRAVGFIEMTFRLVDTMRYMIFDMVHRVGLSMLSRQQADPVALERSFRDNTRFMALFAYPILAGLGVTSSELVPVLLGDEWAPVIPLMQTLALASIIQFIVYQSEVVANSLGRPALPALVFGTMPVTVVVAMVAIRPASALGALWVWVASMLGLAPIWIVLIRRLTGWSTATLLAPGTPALAAAAVMAAVVLACDVLLLEGAAPLLRLAIKIAVGLAAYATVTLAFNRRALIEFLALVRHGRAEPA